MGEASISHDVLVKEIVRQRFDNPQWEVFVNTEEKKERGLLIGGSVVYPDIVVFKIGTNEVIGVGEIEMEETVNEERARRWQALSRVAPSLWLYVPKSKLEEARKLIKDLRLRNAMLRLWESTEGIVSVIEP